MLANNETNILTNDIKNLQDQINLKVNRLEEINKEKDELIKQHETKIEELLSQKNEIITSPSNNPGNIQALKIFYNINYFNEYVKNLYKVNKWSIKPQSYKERAEILKKYSYFFEIRNEFENKKLVNRQITDEQIVSFFDTLYLMHRILNSINDHSLKQEMKIIMEYVIPTPERDRIDYLLLYRNSILLIEFSKGKSINTLHDEQSTKQKQLESYKSKLETNINNSKIKIDGITCMYLDESTDSNLTRNNSSLDYVKKQIQNLLLNSNKNAFELLASIE